MWRIATCIAYQHDLRMVAVAVAVCALGSFTSAVIIQRAFVAATRTIRMWWLVLAGLITGVTIWTTHYTAMLGYAAQLALRVYTDIVGLSLASCTILAISGWLVAFGDTRQRGMLGGALVGAGLAMAHFLDTYSLRFSAVTRYDLDLLVISVVAGVGLCAGAGWLFQRYRNVPIAWPAALALMTGTLALHFVAMASLTVTPLTTQRRTGGTVDLSAIATVVVFGCIMILVVALTVAYHSQRLALATAADRQRLRTALDALRASETHHRASIELNPQLPWLADASGNVVEMAPHWVELVGGSLADALGLGWAASVHPDDLPGVAALWSRAIENGDGKIADTRYRLRMQDGAYRWFRARARPRRDEAGQITAWYGTLEDIDDQVASELALRESEERYRLASRATNDVIWDWSFEQGRATWGGAVEEVLGYKNLNETTDLKWWLDRIHPRDVDHVIAAQKNAFDSGGSEWDQEYKFRKADGTYIDVASRCLIIRNEHGDPARLVGSMLDITARKQAQESLQQAAYHDPLTKLSNRAHYARMLDRALARAGKTSQYVGLIVLDLNNFKTLNDSMGHAAGDALLCEIAARLLRSAPPEATVARLGGDEFAIILPGLALLDAREETVRKILAPLETPALIEGLRVAISFCAGASIWPRDAETPGELMKCADLALYAAKADLPGTIRGFTPAMREVSESRATMLARARSALDDDRIVPFYQPKVCLRTGQIAGFEALLRWHDHRNGLQPPSSIVAAFDDVELSVLITDRMLDRVLSDVAGWKREGREVGRIAINAATADFRRGDLAERILEKVTRLGLTPSVLELEVTESVLVGQMAGRVGQTLTKLRNAGVTIALDDFGTGYASLTHLQQFPVDVLKIDRSFIDKVSTDTMGSSAVVDALLQMAKAMGITSVAEGIETIAQAEYLVTRGCDLGQGYLFGRPVGRNRVLPLLDDGVGFAARPRPASAMPRY